MTALVGRQGRVAYREAYPTWILVGMDVLAAGILFASFRDAWSVVCNLGGHPSSWIHWTVAGAVVLAIDASILLLEQARSQVKLRGGPTLLNDVWVMCLISLSAVLNVRYLTQTGSLVDQWIGALLGIAIPSTIAVLGVVKGDMLAFNARHRSQTAAEEPRAAEPAEDGADTMTLPLSLAAGAESLGRRPAPLFKLRQ